MKPIPTTTNTIELISMIILLFCKMIAEKKNKIKLIEIVVILFDKNSLFGYYFSSGHKNNFPMGFET